jgi:Leucine-rich repeat (LRR) protein
LLLKSWLGESVAVDIGDNLLKLGFNRFGDWTKARAAQQRANGIAEAVVKDLEDFFAKERVDEDALLPAAFELGETIRSHVNAAFLVNQKLNTNAIEKALVDARPVDEIYRRSEPEHGLYVRLVKELAPRLRVLAPELPDFARERDAVILQKLDEVATHAPMLLEELRRVHEKLDELGKRPAQLAQGFERSYLDAIVKELDYVEILGIDDLDSKSREADLTVAYLSLTARFGEGDKQQRIDFATLLTLLPLFGNRLWIEGGAGSGKSTLVRWAALEAARWRLGRSGSVDVLDIAPDLDNWLNFLRAPMAERPAIQDDSARSRAVPPEAGHSAGLPEKDELRIEAWRARLPFVTYLRYATDGLTLVQLPYLALRTIATPPDGWLLEVLSAAGAGMLLIFDGVDEVPTGRKRKQILKQISDFARRLPKAQILLTSRPGAVEGGALKGFRTVVLEDLSEQQKIEFIDHWHKALAANCECERDNSVIVQLRIAALRELEQQPTLALLATNPLLCAAICALHWLSRRKVVEEALQSQKVSPGSMQTTVLPGSLWNLCEALTRMLVHQRDLDRELGGAAFGPAYSLSYELKREILARIAYGMVAGDLLSAISRKDALAHVQAALTGFREKVAASADEVLRALLERSGVLRGSAEDAVEFVHNTMKAFLAAKFYLGLLSHKEVVRRVAVGSPEELASGLDEIAVFAAASPDHPAYAQRLIEALLSTGASRSDIRKLGILALRCEAAASSHLPQETRARVRGLAPKLFPPRSLHEARQLAALGEKAVPHLKYRRRAKAATSAAAVHCLRLIGTAAAQQAMCAYLETESLIVAEELIHDHNPLEIAAVLKAAQTHETWREVSPPIKSAVRDINALSQLTDLQELHLEGTQVTDLAPLAKFPKLRTLSIGVSTTSSYVGMNPDVNASWVVSQFEDASLASPVTDITPLAGLAGLQWLSLTGTLVSEISPIAGLFQLKGLGLSHTRVSDLSSVAKLTNLQWLFIANTPTSIIAPLAALSELRQLSLEYTAVSDALPIANLNNLRWLSLIATQLPTAEPLATLTNLQWLWLNDTQVADAGPLANLTNLQELALIGTQVADAAPLAKLTNLQGLYLGGTQVADAAPLAKLTNLQGLDLNGTRIADAAPLANLTNLQWLSLDGTQVADAAPLAKLTNLRRLSLAGTRVSPEQVAELKRAFAERGNRFVDISGP